MNATTTRERRAWTYPEIRRLKALTAEGLSWEVVGMRLGRSRESCRAKHDRIFGCRQPIEYEPVTTLQRIGRLVRIEREERGFSQIAWADVLEVHPKRLQRLERGDFLGTDLFLRVLDELDVDLAFVPREKP